MDAHLKELRYSGEHLGVEFGAYIDIGIPILHIILWTCD
jgi:hypothetical protein